MRRKRTLPRKEFRRARRRARYAFCDKTGAIRTVREAVGRQF